MVVPCASNTRHRNEAENGAQRYSKPARASKHRAIRALVVELSKSDMHQTKTGLLLASSDALDTGDPIRFPSGLQLIPVLNQRTSCAPCAHLETQGNRCVLGPLNRCPACASRRSTIIWYREARLYGWAIIILLSPPFKEWLKACLIRHPRNQGIR